MGMLCLVRVCRNLQQIETGIPLDDWRDQQRIGTTVDVTQSTFFFDWTTFAT